MYCVYWSETRLALTEEQIDSWYQLTGEKLDPTATVTTPHRQLLRSNQLTLALELCEELRRRKRNGEAISFIGMVSEDANQVGEMGVDSIVEGKTPDGHVYDWKKRR
jgi:predicted NUDIX family phosphoesterase